MAEEEKALETEYYKFFREDGYTTFGRNPWPVGIWMPEIRGEIVPCKNGYHVCRATDLINWIGPSVARVEVGGDIVEENDKYGSSKVVVRQARNVGFIKNWNSKAMCNFGLDCAEHALYLGEKGIIDPATNLIGMARKYLDNKGDTYTTTFKNMLKERANDFRLALLEEDYERSFISLAVHHAVYAICGSTSEHDTRGFVASASFSARSGHIRIEGDRKEDEWQTNRILQYFNGEVTHLA